MIRKNEIMANARKFDVPISTIERDYVQNILLDSLFSIQTDMAFKGGTCIRKIYISDYRFSDDLDFTLLSDLDRDEIHSILKMTIASAGDGTGIEFQDEIKVEEHENGFEALVYFKSISSGRHNIKIKFDITHPGKEKVLLPLNMKEIIHPYSDEVGAQIKTYSLEEMLAEKIRSIFQRTRPRDLYDVWSLWGRMEMDTVMNILVKKCKDKGVMVDPRELETRKKDFKNAWEQSLKNQLREVPDFEEVFSIVMRRIEDDR